MRRLILLFLMCCAAEAAEPKRPNIVFILLDNVGQEWFGCYGSEEGCTPEIDRLAATGMRVEHCYTAPVCGPSRTVLLTGRYPHSTGFRLHHDAALYSGGGLDPKREVLFPRLFRETGYATGICGKWQVNNLYDEPDVLTEHGFEQQLAWPGSLDPKKVRGAELERYWQAVKREDVEETTAFIQHIENRYWDPVFLRNGKREEHPGKFGPDVAQEFALQFVREHREKPFLLYYPMLLTHGQTFTMPVVPTPDDPSANRPHQEMFAGMLRHADKLIGQFVAELDRLGLRDNTLIFVASDNGTEKSLRARRDGRVVAGGLYTLTEAGGDVALLANNPKLIPAGRTLALADFTDIYPTLCELAAVPLWPNHEVDGKSFASYLVGETDTPPREWILNEYHETRVVREARFKLYSDGRFFDANADPEEKHDLGKMEGAARERLQRVLDQLPPDVEPPFLLRSQSGFKLRSEARKNSVEAAPGPAWKRHAIDATSRGADGVKLGDINGDRLPDVVTGWEEGGEVRVYLHPGFGKTKAPWPMITVGKVPSPEEAIFADLDGDGVLEVVSCTEGKARNVYWHRCREGKAALADPAAWRTEIFPATAGKQMWMQALTMNVDGLYGDDVILAAKGPEAAIGWLQAPRNATDLGAWRYRSLRTAGWIMSLILNDMDRDGDADVIFSDRKGERTGVFWLENPGASGVQQEAFWKEHLIGGAGRQVMFADSGDIDGDGLVDVAVAVKPVDAMIFLRKADGAWKEKTLHLGEDSLGDAKAVKIADVNMDGLMDLLYTCENAKGEREGIIWLEQQKAGPWKQHTLGGPEGLKYDLMQTLDLDNDGDLDVMTCEERDQLGVVWYENPAR
ncbi:MAG TPA: sulfatase-like hydrolase/transferase [Prosthecobacter sp.]|nr:sulfatase-like hydrolase/transferase [Prosthecobacter sp.]